MEPRQRSSIAKWSQPIPEDMLRLIKGAVHDTFQERLGDMEVHVQGKLFPEEIWLRIGFSKPGLLRQTNYEVSMDLVDTAKVHEDIQFLVEALGALIDSHLNVEGAEEIPTRWTPWTFENRKLFVQSSTENSGLEAEADRLLAESGGLDDEAELENDTDDPSDPQNLH